MKRSFIAAAALASVTLALGTGASPAQDLTATPIYGSTKLNAGFAPQDIALTAGGELDAGTAIGGAGFCRGFISNAPSYVVRYTPGDADLVISATSESDTTLVVSGPDGAWSCDDDSGGSLNPMLTIAAPATGNYLVWVGTYGSNRSEAATLSISEAVTPGLDSAAAPLSGSGTLQFGFLPDPSVVQLTAGGPLSASEAVESNCRGYISEAPNYALDFTAGGTLPLIISAESERDLTLVIQGPDGTWHCDDDGGVEALNPALTFQNPLSGRHLIWVGTYSSGLSELATLNISELESL